MKKMLVLNHFPIVNPPISGGTLRYFHLYRELSRYYDITLLSQTFGHKSGRFQYSPTFREYKIEKDPLYNKHGEDFQFIHNSYEFTLIMHILLSYRTTIYKKYFEELYNRTDIIIHESPYLLGYDRYLGLDRKLRIYNSHNHEYVLANKIWKNDKAREFLPTIL